MSRHPIPVEGRFWARVRRSEGCWWWTASCDSYGYGQISVDAHLVRAHRLSWELHNGPIPDGAHVLHSCDQPSCVNPEHLFLGDHATNMIDKVAKGRSWRPGSDGARWLPNAKVDEAAVVSIRIRAVAGEPQWRIGADYGISQGAVSLIVRRQTWVHVP